MRTYNNVRKERNEKGRKCIRGRERRKESEDSRLYGRKTTKDRNGALSRCERKENHLIRIRKKK